MMVLSLDLRVDRSRNYPDSRCGKAPRRVLRRHRAGAHAVRAQVTDASTLSRRSGSVGFEAYMLCCICGSSSIRRWHCDVLQTP